MQYRVDMPVPGRGLGEKLNDMLAWCRANAGLGNYDQHGYIESGPEEREPLAFVRFYFVSARDAARFRHAFAAVTLTSLRDDHRHEGKAPAVGS